MSKWYVSLVGLLVVSAAASVLLGCSGGANPTLAQNSASFKTGTVTVRFINTRGRTALPVDIPVTFTGMSLLNATTSDTTPDPQNWLASFNPTNPNIPIPIIQGPTLVDLLPGGSSTNTTAVSPAQVPAQLYSTIRLIFNPADFAGLQNLPVNPNTLSGLIPITGGMQVNAGDTVTLLVDFFAQQAQVQQ